MKFLITIVGPTAVGKSDLAVKVAQQYQWEIVSADSRQFYQELNIGTAKPSAQQLQSVPHHFINNLSIKDSYNAGQFEVEALQLLDRLYQKHDAVLMVGGSGMYVDAVCTGFSEMPKVSEEVRSHYNKLLQDKGLPFLVQELGRLDPQTVQEIDTSNPQRVVRALEVIHATGEKFSTFKGKQPAKRPFEVVKIGIEMEREELYARIDARMDDMIRDGLFDEAAHLHPFKDLYALQTVGYSEIFGFMDNQYDREEAIRLLKRNSRRYAKRQLTWFKRDPQVTWFRPEEYQEVMNHIGGIVNKPGES